MPAFNQPTPNDTGVENFTGRSQGTGPNRTFEALFKGLGNTVADYSTVRDKVTQGQITDDAQSILDQTNNEFGLTPPAGMQDGLAQMQTLQNAVIQGKISEVNYYGRLATLSKQLRSKYPGYEQIVDQKIQSVTGTRPANAYRDAIFQELNKNASLANSEENFRRNYDKQNAAELSMLYGNDYFENPQKYDFNRVQADVGAFKARQLGIKMQKDQLELDASQGQANDKQVGKTMSADFSFITQSAMSHAIGLNKPSAMDTINGFIKAGGGSPEDTKAFIDNISQMEGTLRTTLYQRGQEYVQKGLATQDAVNKAIDAAMYPVTKAKEAVLGGDFKLAAQYALLGKASTDQQTYEMLKDPFFKTGSGLTTINKSLGDVYFNTNQETAIGKAQIVATDLAGQAMAGRPDAIAKAIDTGDDRLGTAVVQQSLKIMTDPKIPSEEFHNIFQQFFGQKAKDFMDPRVVNQKDLDKIYMKFTSPEMTNSVFTKGSAQDQHDYIEWALTKATAIPAFRNTAGDVNSLLPDGTSLIWDSKTHRLGLHIPEGYTGDSMNPLRAFEPPFMRSASTAPVRTAISRFNQVLQNLDPIMAKTGADADETAKAFVRSMALSIDGQNPDTTPSSKKSFWGSVLQSIKDANDRANKVSENDYFGETLPEAGGNSLFDFVGEAAQGAVNLGKGAVDLVKSDVKKSADKFFPKLDISTKRGYTPDVKDVQPEVLQNFTDLQSAWGSNLPIVSGYRDPDRNRRAGGAKHSQHMSGNALDIDVSSLSKSQRVELIKMARAHGFTGIGVYPNSLHIDMGRQRHWGPNYHADSTPAWAMAALQ